MAISMNNKETAIMAFMMKLLIIINDKLMDYALASFSLINTIVDSSDLRGPREVTIHHALF